MQFQIRHAKIGDVRELEELIARSARALGKNDYTVEQIEAALGNAWGVDTQLIRDCTYFVVKVEGVIAACGGWSRRGTLFGGDAQHGRAPDFLDATKDAARIRAFFVHPDYARRGIGSFLLEHCENAARAEGFRSTELVATLPGEKLYSRFGYRSLERIEHRLPDGLTIQFVRMKKERL